MKKLLILIIFVFLAAALIGSAEESKKILNIQKAYVFLPESLLISETDLNCSYFIKADMAQDIRIVGKHLSTHERKEFSDHDELVINKGSRAGLKEGDLLMIISQGRVIRHPRNHDRLGLYFLKKSLAEITCIYDERAVIQLQKGCNPVNVGDFGILYKPEQTLFAQKIDYKLCRIPSNAVSGHVVFFDLAMGIPGEIAGDSQYVTVDLGEGVVGKGTFLLIYRQVASDLPPLIIGLGIVIHSENTNSTVKILDASSDVKINDRMLVLPKELKTVPGSAGERENIPIVEMLQTESEEPGLTEGEPGADEMIANLKVDVLFDFDGRVPSGDHAADFTAIKDFIAAKSEYLITLRGYTCSIGREEYNLRLSSDRVETIKNILINQYGIDAAHIETFFYGEKEPQFDNSSEVERKKNRLVKIEVNGK
ncbi:MAG: OmpA family protein [Acidobacteria bacterium]|nr:OmpA family protein [Acidobacteriota bacterium]MBU4307641.1 OmpA family protein [Acidobacteriota bacterium]MBU4404387.1 OmpA family protein [Acidobacteriota bacterium]MCG2810445.1 OmpA family protein [Candidatus Aminicenantes bacterium]